MNIASIRLPFDFSHPPVVVGGLAMEYYQLRPAGPDVDLIAHADDISSLAKAHPQSLKQLWGDFGVVVGRFEIWKTIAGFDYDWARKGAKSVGQLSIISLEKLLIMKAIAASASAKYQQDTQRILTKIQKGQTKSFKLLEEQNIQIIRELDDPEFLEKS